MKQFRKISQKTLVMLTLILIIIQLLLPLTVIAEDINPTNEEEVSEPLQADGEKSGDQLENQNPSDEEIVTDSSEDDSSEKSLTEPQEAEKDEAITLEKDLDNGIKVSLEGLKSDFPDFSNSKSSLTLEVEQLEKEDSEHLKVKDAFEDQVNTQLSEDKQVSELLFFDIAVTQDGNRIIPNNNVKLRFEKTTETDSKALSDYEKVMVQYFDEDDEDEEADKIEEVTNLKLIDNSIQMDFNSSSLYSIALIDNKRTVNTDEEIVLTETLPNSGINVTITGSRSEITDDEGEISLSIKELDKNNSEDAKQIETNLKNLKPSLPTDIQDAIGTSYEPNLEDKSEDLIEETIHDTHLDIELLVNGQAVKPKEPLKVTFEGIPSSQETSESVQIFHIDETTQIAEEKEVTVTDDNRLETEFDSFSPVVILDIDSGDSNEVEKKDNSSMPTTMSFSNNLEETNIPPDISDVVSFEGPTLVNEEDQIWDITTRVKRSADFVLVIDNSKQMKDTPKKWDSKSGENWGDEPIIENNPPESKTAMKYVQNGNIDLIKNIRKEIPNSKFAIVTFSDEAKIIHEFDGDQSNTALIDAIESIDATENGNRNLEAGIKEGHKLLKEKQNVEGRALHTYMAIIANGLPTSSNQIVDNTGEQEVLNHSKAAEDAGHALRNDTNIGIDGIYSIEVGVNHKTESTKVLEKISTGEYLYSPMYHDHISSRYKLMAKKILEEDMKEKERNISIRTTLPDGFSIVENSDSTEHGTIGMTQEKNNQIIQWHINGDKFFIDENGNKRFVNKNGVYSVDNKGNIINSEEVNKQFSTNSQIRSQVFVDTNGYIYFVDTNNNNKKYFANDENKKFYFDSEETIDYGNNIFFSSESEEKFLMDKHGDIYNGDKIDIDKKISGKNFVDEHNKRFFKYFVDGDDKFLKMTYRIQFNPDSLPEQVIPPKDNPLETSIIYDGIYDGKEITTLDSSESPSVKIKPLITDFSFTLVNEEAEPLNGAQFTLDPTGNGGVAELMEEGGTFTFKNLKEGEYILTQTKAPEGYRLPTESWTITIERNSETGDFEIIIPENDPLLTKIDSGYAIRNEEQDPSEFPETGGLGILPFITLGMVITASFTGYYNKKENNGGKKDDKKI